jgi:MraZ protein
VSETSAPGAAGRNVAASKSFASQALNAIDAKGRVSVPSFIRESIVERLKAAGDSDTGRASELMIGPDPKGRLLNAYDAIGMDELDAQLRASVADLPAAERREALTNANRRERGALFKVVFDNVGRMIIPPHLREFVGIKDRAYFIGVGDFFEIWSPDRFRQEFADDRVALMMLDSLGRGARPA